MSNKIIMILMLFNNFSLVHIYLEYTFAKLCHFFIHGRELKSQCVS